MIKGAVLLVAALALGELFREPSITNLCQVPSGIMNKNREPQSRRLYILFDCQLPLTFVISQLKELA